MILYIGSDVGTLEPLLFGLGKETLHLAVEAVTHQLEGDVGVAVDAWRLPLGGEELEDLIDVGHIEVSAEAEVLGPPVVASEEGMDVGEPALSGGGVAEVTHVELSGEVGMEGLGGRGGEFLLVLIDSPEYLGDGILPLGFLAEHVFLTSRGIEVDASHAGSLLPAVVLFLHEEVELVQAVAPRAVLLLVIVKWLEEANHRHATFMLQLFHRCKLL